MKCHTYKLPHESLKRKILTKAELRIFYVLEK